MPVRLAVLAVSVALFVGCGKHDAEIKVYRLAKPDGASASESPPTMDNSLASTNVDSRSTVERVPRAGANVTTPSNWEPQPLSQMRQASFLVHGANGTAADISFVTLGPAAGNVLDNVNRWLGQLGQPPITAEKLTTIVQKLSTPSGEVDVVDLNGKPENGDAAKDGRIVGAIASDQSGTAFYKMRGNADLVGAEKGNFLKWIAQMRSASGQATGTSTSASSADVPDQPHIKWDVPSGWSSTPASAMRYASFASSDQSGKVDISIVTFPGEGGDDLGNINRWRQQIGLGPTDKTGGATQLKSNDATFSLIDIAGPSARTIAAWTRNNGRAWFIKMTGPSPAVEKEKPNFVKFVQSIQLGS